MRVLLRALLERTIKPPLDPASVPSILTPPTSPKAIHHAIL